MHSKTQLIRDVTNKCGLFCWTMKKTEKDRERKRQKRETFRTISEVPSHFLFSLQLCNVPSLIANSSWHFHPKMSIHFKHGCRTRGFSDVLFWWLLSVCLLSSWSLTMLTTELLQGTDLTCAPCQILASKTKTTLTSWQKDSYNTTGSIWSETLLISRWNKIWIWKDSWFYSKTNPNVSQ